jgi:hypothetical protein
MTMRLVLAAVVSLIAAGAASLFESRPAAAHEHDHEAAMHVMDAHASPTPGGRNISAAYFTIHNPGAEDDRLISVTTPLAGRTELHRTSRGEGGVMTMAEVEGGVAVPAGEHVVFARGGLHVMLLDLAEPLQVGDQVPLTLTFERAGEVSVVAEVRRPGARQAGPPEHQH